jgi:hypothetical protein
MIIILIFTACHLKLKRCELKRELTASFNFAEY